MFNVWIDERVRPMAWKRVKPLSKTHANYYYVCLFFPTQYCIQVVKVRPNNRTVNLITLLSNRQHKGLWDKTAAKYETFINIEDIRIMCIIAH